MSDVVTVNDVELLKNVTNVLWDWSGVSDETPDDFEVISSPGTGLSCTLGDLKDAMSIIQTLLNIVQVTKTIKTK